MTTLLFLPLCIPGPGCRPRPGRDQRGDLGGAGEAIDRRLRGDAVPQGGRGIARADTGKVREQTSVS